MSVMQVIGALVTAGIVVALVTAQGQLWRRILAMLEPVGLALASSRGIETTMHEVR